MRQFSSPTFCTAAIEIRHCRCQKWRPLTRAQRPECKPIDLSIVSCKERRHKTIQYTTKRSIYFFFRTGSASNLQEQIAKQSPAPRISHNPAKTGALKQITTRKKGLLLLWLLGWLTNPGRFTAARVFGSVGSRGPFRGTIGHGARQQADDVDGCGVRCAEGLHMLLLFVSLRPWPGSLLWAEKFD